MQIGRCISCAILATALTAAANAESGGLTLKANDHIALIGNALPDRMQHDGWLETYLQRANPDKKLLIRNMAFSGVAK